MPCQLTITTISLISTSGPTECSLQLVLQAFAATIAGAVCTIGRQAFSNSWAEHLISTVDAVVEAAGYQAMGPSWADNLISTVSGATEAVSHQAVGDSWAEDVISAGCRAAHGGAVSKGFALSLVHCGLWQGGLTGSVTVTLTDGGFIAIVGIWSLG